MNGLGNPAKAHNKENSRGFCECDLETIEFCPKIRKLRSRPGNKQGVLWISLQATISKALAAVLRGMQKNNRELSGELLSDETQNLRPVG
jgi:hypothetical protein